MIKPKTPTKRMMFNLSPEDIRILHTLAEKFGETPSQVIKRALSLTYCVNGLSSFDWIEEDNKIMTSE